MSLTFGKWILIAYAIGVALLIASIVFLFRLDYLIHVDLYNYGLEYSDEWAGRYWTYKDLTLASITIAVFANIIGTAYLFSGKHRALLMPSKSRRGRGFGQMLSVVFLGLGALALVAAVLSNSTAMAFVGLGLVFWGAVFLYTRTGRHVKEALLDKTAMPSLVNLDKLIDELNLKGRAWYLPPEYLRDPAASRIFISRNEETELPEPKQILAEGESLSIIDGNAFSFEPPGSQITTLLEDKLGTSFTRTDLSYFTENIPRVLSEDIEITGSVEVKSLEDRVRVRMEDSSYAQICSETQKLARITSSIGCPICSALACALAKTTGRPVAIESEQATLKNRTISVEYKILEEQ